MSKQGKLILVGGMDNMLFYTKTKDERAKAREQFGWSGEDYRQVLVSPDIEDAVAKPEDFMAFYFRHLSATIVGAGTWKATEFTEPVLKAAAAKLTKQPVYVNHELEIANAVGVNGEIKFVGKSKAADGTEIPGGLEGPIWIDAKLHQDLCRKLTGYPAPVIQSVSVTVVYNWIPSHEFKDRQGNPDEWEFEYRIGTIDPSDGKMVRRIVTEIVAFYETSLVWLGADPYAKILGDDDKPFNIERAAIVGEAEFKKDPLADLYKQKQVYFVKESSLNKENLIHLSKTISSSFSKTGNPAPQKNINSDMENKLLAALAKALGKKEEDITPELLEQFKIVPTADYTALEKFKTDHATEKAAKEKAEGELSTANATIEKYTAICKPEELEAFGKEVAPGDVREMAVLGAGALKAAREECQRLYKLKVGAGKEDANVLNLINKANKDELTGLLKQYGGELIETFGASCKKCGSNDVEFRSSSADENPTGEPKNEERTTMAERNRR